MLYYRPKRKSRFQLIYITVLTSAILLLLLIARYPTMVERYYSEGLYLVICRLLHPIFNFFPFSLGDFFYIGAILYLIYAFYSLIKLALKREFKKMPGVFLRIIIGMETGVLIFYVFWGLNYFRVPAGERLSLRDTNYTTADLKAATAMLIDSANLYRARVTPGDLLQNNNLIYKTAEKAIRKLSADSVDFRAYSPAIKPSLLTPLLNYMGTSGYFNPFTGEAQVNYEMPVFERPVTACHEMSHQIGFALEDEADFVGFLAGKDSNDPLLHYSAFHLAVDEFMHALRYRDTSANNELKKRLSAAVRNDFKTERAYWLSYQGKTDILSGIFYDNFLKANNQPHGLNTYNRMVLLVMALYRNKVHASPQPSPK